jgi:sugar lactone lactonase YvrE
MAEFEYHDHNRAWRIYPDGTTVELTHSLSGATGVAVLPDSTVLVAEMLRNRVVRLGPNNTLLAFAGTGHQGNAGDGGPAVSANLMYPKGLAIAADGSVYIIDYQAIRRVGPDGIISTVAMVGGNDIALLSDGGIAVRS